MKVHIVGCGLSGVTAAVLLRERGHEVEIFEIRDHIGGNCFDYKTQGVTVHKYGAHIFHTNDDEVWEFLNRYSRFNDYVHRVRANTSLGLISIPYNKKTAAQLGRDLDKKEIKELIFRDYSERHWGIPWEELPPSISGRLPDKRGNFDDRYFTDKYQGQPTDGYTAMFKAMLDGITVNLNTKEEDWRRHSCDLLIFTGKLDAYFDYQWGRLPYRSLRFETFRAAKNPLFSFENGGVINECNSQPFNRTSDNSVYLNEQVQESIFTRDYPEEHNKTNLPIYPKNFGTGHTLYSQHYKKAASSQLNTIFLGRLATYSYLDMWMAIKQVMVKLKDA